MNIDEKRHHRYEKYSFPVLKWFYKKKHLLDSLKLLVSKKVLTYCEHSVGSGDLLFYTTARN